MIRSANSCAIASPIVRAAVSFLPPLLASAAYWHRAGAEPQIGMDFKLFYTIAVAWRLELDPYHDAGLKQAWGRAGDPTISAPGWPNTITVYPLTLAPVIAPFTLLPFRPALAVWMLLSAGLVGSVIWVFLRDGNGRWAPIVAAAVLLCSYPLQLALSVGQFAVPVGCLMFHVARQSYWPVASGMAFGVTLVKFPLAWPLAPLLVLRRQWAALLTAAAVQAGLAALASSRWHDGGVFGWIERMLENIRLSHAPGGLIDPTSPAHSANQLDLAALLWRIAPAATVTAKPLVLVMVLVAIAAVIRRRVARDRPELVYVAVLAVSLPAYYHRLYDLFALHTAAIWLLLRNDLDRRSTTWVCCGLVLSALPGAQLNRGQPIASWWQVVFVQSIAEWGLLAIIVGLLIELWRPRVLADSSTAPGCQ